MKIDRGFNIFGTARHFKFQHLGSLIRETIGVLIFWGQQCTVDSSTLRLTSTRSDRGFKIIRTMRQVPGDPPIRETIGGSIFLDKNYNTFEVPRYEKR